MQLHTRLTKSLPTVAGFVLHLVCRTFSKKKVHFLAFSRTLSQSFGYVHSYICLSLFRSYLFLMVSIFNGFLRVYLYIVYTLPLVAFDFVVFAVSISFISHGLYFYSFCLLFSGEMILGRFHLRNTTLIRRNQN